MAQAACPKCSSAKIIPAVPVLDQGEYSDGYLHAGLVTKPHALILKGLVRVEIQANICGACGHTELFVDNPQKIYDAYLEHKQHR